MRLRLLVEVNLCQGMVGRKESGKDTGTDCRKFSKNWPICENLLQLETAFTYFKKKCKQTPTPNRRQ